MWGSAGLCWGLGGSIGSMVSCGGDGGGEASALVRLLEVLLGSHQGLVGGGHGSPCMARFGEQAHGVDVVVPETQDDMF